MDYRKLLEACIFFESQIGNDNLFRDDKFVKKYGNELIYCWENKKNILDFDCWTWIEELLNKKISYDEYIKIEDRIDEILEIEKSDIEKIDLLRSCLKEIRAEQIAQTDKMIF